MSFYVEAIETSVAVNMLLIEVKASISMADIGRSNYFTKNQNKTMDMELHVFSATCMLKVLFFKL